VLETLPVFSLAIILMMSSGEHLDFNYLDFTQSQMSSNNCHLKLSKLKASADNGCENKRFEVDLHKEKGVF